ncbi:MAG TPA: D-fructose-6-phosphate amidotransferase [Blastocatellia bacterium]|nr:D-fructose-6-phosphate amidotransferase [Blastocatellia bacterium]
MIENVELTLSHVGLGCLNEYALITLFTNALFHRLSVGKQRPPQAIVDKNGEVLYPGYYMTHLTVPPGRPLERYSAWQTYSIGADVQVFGGMLMESRYILGDAGEISDDPQSWDSNSFPSMRGSSMFIVDRIGREPQVSIPKAGLIDHLPKLTTAPTAMDKFRKLRSQGTAEMQFRGNVPSCRPVVYKVEPGRDAAAGQDRIYVSHTMLFAKFVEIMDHAERVFLTEEAWPPFPTRLMDCRTVIERETYYFGTPEPDDTIQTGITAQLNSCAADFHGLSSEIIPAGLLTFMIEVYHRRTNSLLAVSKVTKLLAVPSSEQSLLHDTQRLISHYCSQ